MKKAELVFVPAPGHGHLFSAIEFANLLVERDERLSITVLVMASVKEHTSKLAIHANISFIELPHLVELPPTKTTSKPPEKYLTEFIESQTTSVKEAIVKHVLPNSPRLLGLVVDLFCTAMIDVANELGLPTYVFFTSSAAFLAFMFYLPHRHERQGGRGFEESEYESIIPGYNNPVSACVFPTVGFNKEGYDMILNHARRYKEVEGILVNTFLDLESHAISTLLTHHLPSVYTVGPLINHKNQNNTQSESQEIMKWLDSQPPSSVVFLCFGSRGCFDVPQLIEIALGIERSGYRFLWSISVGSKDNSLLQKIENTDHQTVLPEGFPDRIKGRGLTCGWVPQVEVLAHKAVGGFVSHCGWNSILESFWFGVPILTWPLYAEQQLNAFQMVKEFGIAFEFKLDSRMFSDDIVKGDEIAKAVKCLMEEDSEVRKKVKDMSVKSRKALIAGGSSYASVGHWIDTMLSSN